MIIKGSLNDEVKQIALSCLQSSNPIKCVFDTVYENIVYYPDPEMRQIVKAVHCILKAQRGNCVDYTVLIGAILLAMNIPFEIKAVSFSGNDMEHVYIKTKSGITLDPVIGQIQDGSETQYNRSQIQGQFNKEVKYTKAKVYTMPTLEILQGIKDIKENKNTVIIPRIRMRRYHSNTQLQGLFDNPLQTIQNEFNAAQNTISNQTNAAQTTVSNFVNDTVTSTKNITNAAWNTTGNATIDFLNSPFSGLGGQIITGILGKNPLWNKIGGWSGVEKGLSKVFGQKTMTKQKFPVLPVAIGAAALGGLLLFND